MDSWIGSQIPTVQTMKGLVLFSLANKKGVLFLPAGNLPYLCGGTAGDDVLHGGSANRSFATR